MYVITTRSYYDNCICLLQSPSNCSCCMILPSCQVYTGALVQSFQTSRLRLDFFYSPLCAARRPPSARSTFDLREASSCFLGNRFTTKREANTYCCRLGCLFCSLRAGNNELNVEGLLLARRELTGKEKS